MSIVAKHIKVEFLSHNRKAVCAPNPDYPEGMDVDLTEPQATACQTAIPYPAECCGVWLLQCTACGTSVAVTAAGRPDDVRSVKIPCRTIRREKPH